jgi:hypothetical protein
MPYPYDVGYLLNVYLNSNLPYEIWYLKGFTSLSCSVISIKQYVSTFLQSVLLRQHEQVWSRKQRIRQLFNTDESWKSYALSQKFCLQFGWHSMFCFRIAGKWRGGAGVKTWHTRGRRSAPERYNFSLRAPAGGPHRVRMPQGTRALQSRYVSIGQIVRLFFKALPDTDDIKLATCFREPRTAQRGACGAIAGPDARHVARILRCPTQSKIR